MNAKYAALTARAAMRRGGGRDPLERSDQEARRHGWPGLA